MGQGSTTHTYQYDFENRLIHASTGGHNLDYTYDSGGMRTQRVLDGQILNYLLDPNQSYTQVVAEQDQAGNLLNTYLYGDDLIQKMEDNGDAHYYHYDGLGSTRFLTDDAGVESDSYRYTAYGEVEGESGSTVNNYRFAGEQFDAELGMYYLRTRYYDPSVGRFGSMDPFAGVSNNPTSLHRYLYANSDPVNMTDPSGLFTLAGAMRTFAGRSILSTRALGIRNPKSYIRNAVKVLQKAAERWARDCARARNKKCNSPLNIWLIGADLGTYLEHITLAQLDGKLPLLHYKKGGHPKKPRNPPPGYMPWHGEWYNFTPAGECPPGNAKKNGVECDEYPMNATLEGGEKNYYDQLPGVSLRYISQTDNRNAGKKFKKFLSKCAVASTKHTPTSSSLFVVIPTLGLPQTHSYCGLKKANRRR